MGTYNVPRNTKGENRILFIFSNKSFLYTVIGIIIGSVLILSVAPVKVITFLIYILILQQIEGNLIYPKVVGGKIGLPSIWVLVGVMAGGSIGGVFGMLLGVPILSVFYALLKEYVNSKKSFKETVLEKIESL